MCKLLIAEDENKSRKAMRESIDWESLGILEVREASNGLEALNIAAEFNPQIIITDIKMPEMDGIELSKKILELNSDVHIIITTAYNDPSYLHSAIKLKAVDYILKPINISELVSAVKSAINLYRQNQEQKFFKKETGNIIEKNMPKYRDEFYDFIVSRNVNPQLETATVADISRLSRDSLLIDSIKKMVECSYNNVDLSVKSIADKIMYTSAYVCMIFKSNTGCTLNDYLTLYRIKKAKELLGNVTLKLYDVSSAVGFNDENYFSKVFKKYEGVTPIEYRKRGLCNEK